jgi:P27 family predicted phage terminase small subunit
MATGGRKPKSTALKILEGVDEYRINRDSPIPTDSDVRPPRELTAGAQRHWDAVAPDLIARKVVTSWDAEVLARYCEWADRYERISADLERDGFTVKGRLDGQVKNPKWQLLRDSSEQTSKLGALLGLNPSDRSRLAVDPDTSKSYAERLLS